MQFKITLSFVMLNLAIIQAMPVPTSESDKVVASTFFEEKGESSAQPQASAGGIIGADVSGDNEAKVYSNEATQPTEQVLQDTRTDKLTTLIPDDQRIKDEDDRGNVPQNVEDTNKGTDKEEQRRLEVLRKLRLKRFGTKTGEEPVEGKAAQEHSEEEEAREHPQVETAQEHPEEEATREHPQEEAAQTEGEPVHGEAAPEHPQVEAAQEQPEEEAAQTEGEPVHGEAAPEYTQVEAAQEQPEQEAGREHPQVETAQTEGEPVHGEAAPEHPQVEAAQEQPEEEAAQTEGEPVHGEAAPEHIQGEPAQSEREPVQGEAQKPSQADPESPADPGVQDPANAAVSSAQAPSAPVATAKAPVVQPSRAKNTDDRRVRNQSATPPDNDDTGDARNKELGAPDDEARAGMSKTATAVMMVGTGAVGAGGIAVGLVHGWDNRGAIKLFASEQLSKLRSLFSGHKKTAPLVV